MKDMQLVGLHTWNSKNGPTFQNTLGRSSRIDFISMAKQVGYLANAPFLQDGARHTPLLVGLCYKIYQRCRRTDLFTAHLKQQCIIDSRDDTLKWQSCMNNINQTLRHTNVHDLDTVTKIMTTGVLQAYHQKSLTSSVGLCSLKNKWEHFRQVRIPSPANLQNVFQKWHQHTLFRKYDKMHTQTVRQHRQRKVELMLEEAQQAHQKHDAYQLFRIINKHCPKRGLKRIHLKDSTGHFLSPTEETAAYGSYIQRMWDGPKLKVPDLPPPGVPFTEQPIFAPRAAWRNQSHFLAPMIYTLLQTWWTMTPPHIPQTWKDGWTVFLPKPNKAATKVENLRVLALQDPVGKAILKLLTKMAMHETLHSICHLPQYAYLPMRSTRDALMKVAEHCAATRRILMGQARSIHIPSKAQHKPECCGGIQIFLDLHRAFDQLPR